MKNPFASFFRSVLERIIRPRRIPEVPTLSAERFRELLIETLDDPATARLLARRLLLPIFPIQGGQPPFNASVICPGSFGTDASCSAGDYAFPNSKVGIGRSTPQAKLHVKGGGVSIEDDRGAGRRGFVQDGEDDPRTVLYRGGSDETPDITILRNFPPSTPPEPEEEVKWTLLRVWAPKVPSGTPDREATISLVRDLNSTDDDSQEFIDIYNNGYHSTGSVQHGIRIQKRTGQTTAQYRDFVFDKFDNVNAKVKLLVINTDAGNVVVGNKATAGAKLDVYDGDIYVSSSGRGIIFKSPDGSVCKKLTIDNSGNPVWTTVTCP